MVFLWLVTSCWVTLCYTVICLDIFLSDNIYKVQKFELGRGGKCVMEDISTSKLTNWEHTSGSMLLHSPTASTPDSPSEQASMQLPFPFKVPPGRISQLTPSYELCECPLGLLHSGLSCMETTL